MRSRVCVLLLALVLSACGNGGNKNAAGGTGSTESTGPTGSTSTTAAGTTASTVKKTRVEYPSGGPSGPVFPPGTHAYELLATGRCNELLNAVQGEWGQPTGPERTTNGVPLEQYHLYRAAAEVCLQRWDAAIADLKRLQALPPGTAFTNSHCPETIDGTCDRCHQVVFRWVTDLVQRRTAEPAFTPDFVTAKGPNPCPSSTSTSSSSASSSSTSSSTTSSTRVTSTAAP